MTKRKDNIEKVKTKHGVMDISKKTGKLVQKKGFKSGKEWKGNAAGRPKGSRNKKSIEKAQDLIDKSSEAAAKFLTDVVSGNYEELGVNKDELTIKNRMDAAKEILKKAVADESGKKSLEETPDTYDSITKEIDGSHTIEGEYDDGLPIIQNYSDETLLEQEKSETKRI